MLRNNQNDLNYSPQEVGFSGGGYGGAPVIAPTFVSAPSQPYSYVPPVAPVAPVAPVFGGGFGGFGGGGNWLELLIASQLIGNNGFGRGGHDHGHFPFPFPNPCKDDDGDNSRGLAILAAIAANKDTTVGEGRAVLSALSNAKDTTVAEARALSHAICESEKTNLIQFNALAIQNSNNTQSIKDQATLQHAAILAAINNGEVNRLRDELNNERRGLDRRDLEINIANTNTNVQAQFQAQAQAQLQRDLDEHRRRFDNREIEINNINTNTNVQAQLQAQAQAQLVRDYEHNRRFDNLFSQVTQVAKNQNDVINFGTMAASGNQTSSATNVNSKLQQ